MLKIKGTKRQNPENYFSENNQKRETDNIFLYYDKYKLVNENTVKYPINPSLNILKENGYNFPVIDANRYFNFEIKYNIYGGWG